MKQLLTASLLFGFTVSPALGQSSASVSAGNLSGTAQAGPPERHAEGPRTDDTAPCNSRGMTVRSANGSSSASASASTSGGGESVVAGGGSPGSRTEYFGCETKGPKSGTR